LQQKPLKQCCGLPDGAHDGIECLAVSNVLDRQGMTFKLIDQVA
jgi:hypothetical protein